MRVFLVAVVVLTTAANCPTGVYDNRRAKCELTSPTRCTQYLKVGFLRDIATSDLFATEATECLSQNGLLADGECTNESIVAKCSTTIDLSNPSVRHGSGTLIFYADPENPAEFCPLQDFETTNGD